MAGDRGHLIDDDLFLAECVAPLASRFLMASSPTSIENLKKHLEINTFKLHSDFNQARIPRARLLRVMHELPSRRFEHVVFQSFEEVSTLLFMLLNPRKQIHLIVTNNLRPDRLKRHPMLGGFFLKQVFRRAASITVHCQHEVEKVIELTEGDRSDRVFVKPFHKIAQRKEPSPAFEQRNPTILFLGPHLAHKTVSPALQLIKHDKTRRFHYQFCAMNEVPKGLEELCRERDNVEVMRGYLSDQQYYQLFRDAALVLLTHDKNYEGVLSGAFCDAAASGTPVISRDIAPVSEYFDRFGPLGFIVDCESPNWCSRILDSDLESDYPMFQRNLASLRDSCSINAIRDVFRDILRVQPDYEQSRVA